MSESSPSPPSMVSLPLPAFRVSSPLPPLSVSAPSFVVIVSLPLPPITVSPPLPVVTVSFPPSASTLTPSSPNTKVSSCSVALCKASILRSVPSLSSMFSTAALELVAFLRVMESVAFGLLGSSIVMRISLPEMMTLRSSFVIPSPNLMVSTPPSRELALL